MKQQPDRSLVPKLRFPEFRDAREWEVKKLKQLTSLITKGTTPTSVGYKFTDSGINFIKIESITEEGAIDFSKIATISEECNEALKRSQLQKNDILFSIAGALGVIFIVKDDVLPANTNQALAILRLNDQNSIDFISAFLKTQNIYLEIKKIKAGAAQLNISLGQLGDFDIFLPTLPEQQKIADCLSFLDDRCAAETQKLETLKAHKKGLMQKLFPAEGETIPKLRFPEFQDAGEWKKGTIDDLAITTMGNAFKSNNFVENGIQLIRMGNLYQGELQLNRMPVYLPSIFSEEYSNFLVNPLDLLMSMTGTVGKKDYGFIVQVPRNCKQLLLNQRVIKIEPKNNCIKEFLLQMLKNESLLNRLYSSAGGTKQANLSTQQLKNLTVNFPQKHEQRKIADCLSSLDELIAAQIQKIETLKRHKKGLMQQLFPSVEEVRE